MVRSRSKVIGMLFLIAGVAVAHEQRLHQNRATEGEVIDVQGEQLTLKTASGTAAITLLDETKIERDSKAGGRADLVPGAHVAVFGTKLPTGEVVAKEIVIHATEHQRPAPGSSP